MSARVFDQLVTKQAELSGIVATLANEARTATDEEKSKLTALKIDIDAIQKSWTDNGRKAFLAGIDRTEPKTGLVLKGADSFADHFKSSYAPEDEHLNLGRLLKGVVLGEWNGAELEKKAMMTSIPSAGGFLIPSVLSNRIIDLARNKSVMVAAGAGTVPMTSTTLDMARVLSDPSVAWYAENGTISETDLTLGRMTFSAKKMACVCRISNELLEDAANSQSIIESAIAAVMALELDRTGLFGAGIGQPLGIANTASLGSSQTGIGTPADYDAFLTAIYDIMGYNFMPNATIYSPRTAKRLAVMQTGIASDETKLVPPADFVALSKHISTQVPNTLGAGSDSAAFVGDFSQYLFALRSDIRLEVSREADTAFMKDQTLIRAIWRGDGQVVQSRAFGYLAGIS